MPELTARVARASNPAGTTAMWVRDCLDGLWQDEDLATWYPSPGFSPARLATASLLQFLLHLSVRQAGEAVRCRIDFKYALAMELDDPGFHHRLLSDFRERLGEDDRADALLSLALARLRSARLFIERGRQRTDSTHVWSAARDLTRLEMVLETVRAAPEEAAVLAPEVLDGLVVQDWASRYGRPVRLPAQPSCPAGRLGDAGQDSRRLLERLAAIGPLGARADVRRRILVQNFLVDSANRMRPRRPADGVPKGGRRLASPYYADARRVIRGNTRWAGYLVHVTETCDDESVNLITNIATTGPVRDTQALPGIHTRLGRRGLLPVEHLNDGYLSVEQLQDSHSVFGIDLVGPVEARGAWQKKAATGFARDDFTIDFDARTVTCPAGEATPPAPGAPHPPWPPTPHAKTHLQQVLTAIAINLQQLATHSRTPSPRRIDTFQQDLDWECLINGGSVDHGDAK
ncbi:transposase [Streptomyces sp. NRRL F-5123]|uniref:transposase n=1 Tax=Streptomyces sp. NRRL F-5123 TaxID=1463856 RepID=UPI00131C98A1|nr:transposase [Streptomyces sp. NRRL F-5123]